jgi:acetyltransferase-like isoleucine patch superfamily enzyme
MKDLKEIDKLCFITEGSDRAFHHTRIALSTFISNNPWFSGTAIILSLDDDQLSNHNKSILNIIYDDIKIVIIPRSELNELNTKVVKRRELVSIDDYLRIFAFKIKSQGNLYVSNRVATLGNLANILNGDKVSIGSSSESFPGNGSSIDSNIMFVPPRYISDDLYSNLYNSLTSSILNGTHDYLEMFMEINHISVNKLDSTTMVNASIFPNNKYTTFIRYSKSISAILIPDHLLSNNKYSRIQIYWNQQLKRAIDVLKNPKRSSVRRVIDKARKASLRPSVEKGSKLDADVCILISTYNRSKCINELTSRLKSLDASCKIVVVDDASVNSIDVTNIDSYTRFEHNLGKYGWWKTVNTLWEKALTFNCKYYIMMPDDALPNDNMILDAIRLWNQISDPSKIAMHLANNNRERNWTNFNRIDYNSDIYLTQTTEFSFICTREFIQYIIPPIGRNRWNKNPLLGSGVGDKLNRYWVNNKRNIYGVKKSLIHQNCQCTDSVMNYEARKNNPWITK